jgi:hypothetical protein
MAQDVDEVLATQWRDRLKRQAESGLTIAAFCELEGLSESMFYAWKRNLLDSADSAPETTASSAAGETTALEAVGATQLPGKKRRRRLRRSDVVPTGEPAAQPREFLRLPVRGVRSMPWIELTLGDGTVVRIPQENLAALTTVLRTLRPENSGPLGEARHV